MDVDLLVLGALVVDDVGDIVNVDATRGNIGCNQNIDLAITESAQSLLTRTLTEVAVKGSNRETALAKLVGNARSRTLSTTENHSATAASCLQDTRNDLSLVHGVSAVDHLLDRVDGLSLIVRILRADVGRLGHKLTSQRDHRAGHGCREKHHVTVRGNARKQGFHVREEAKVKHLVGLVKDNVFHAVEVQHTLTEQIDQAAGGADDDIRASLECFNLGFKRDTTVDVNDARRQVRGGYPEVFGHLLGELAGRQNDECLRHIRVEKVLVALFIRGDDVFQYGDAESQSLTGTCLGLTNDVVAIQCDGKSQGLDREGVGDAAFFERINDGVTDPEISERFRFESFISRVCNVGGGLFFSGRGGNRAKANNAGGVLRR